MFRHLICARDQEFLNHDTLSRVVAEANRELAVAVFQYGLELMPTIHFLETRVSI
jgi:hypothetical protein